MQIPLLQYIKPCLTNKMWVFTTLTWLWLMLILIWSSSPSTTSTEAYLAHELHPEEHLSLQSFEALQERLQVQEWKSMRWRDKPTSFLPPKVSIPSNHCPVELKPVFGSCCLNGLSTKMNDHRASCFADLVSNYRLLPPTAFYKNMLDVFRLFSSNRAKKTISWHIIGDSIQLQVANGLQCSHHRLGVTANHTTMQEITTTLKKVKYEWLYGPKATVQYDVAMHGTTHNFTITRMYRPPFEQDHTQQMESLLLQGDVIMINFGLHYRWKEKAVFAQHMTLLLKSIQNISIQFPDKIFLWRENSAQHHIAPGGEFSIAYVPSDLMSAKAYKALFSKCSNATTNKRLPSSAVITRKWRDEVVVNISREIGLGVFNLTDLLLSRKHATKTAHSLRGRLYILPFYDYTERFGNMHPYKPNREDTLEAVLFDATTGHTEDIPAYDEVKKRISLELQGKGSGDLYMTCDPTHFCYSPLFWQPWIHQLYLMLQQILLTTPPSLQR